MVDYENAGQIVNQLRQRGSDIGSLDTRAADVIQELMHECMRWDSRAARAERQAKRLINELRPGVVV